MNWIRVPKDYEQYQGFIYLITNIKTGKRYIGLKNMFTVRKLKPLKGYKRVRKKRVEVDWRNYYGSSENLAVDVEKYGKENFKREFLCFCHSKWQLKFMEGKFQTYCEVLSSDKWYNNLISFKCTGYYMKKKPKLMPAGRRLLKEYGIKEEKLIR